MSDSFRCVAVTNLAPFLKSRCLRVVGVSLFDMEVIREANRQAHREFLKKYGDKILASGALLNEDGKIVEGISLFDTEDWHEAKQFADSDPYAVVGIRAETKIVRWRKRWWNGSFLGDKQESI